MTHHNTIPRVQLWIGNVHSVHHELTSYLCSWWCANEIEDQCATCCAIREHRWFFIRRVAPEKTVYLREVIEDVLHDTQFAVDSDQRRVIVFEAADMFGLTVANRLLKLLEEPPAGWFFFLTTERPDMVLPTVRSRCTERRITEQALNSLLHPVVTCLSELHGTTLPRFMQAWEQQPISVAETVEMLDSLVVLWHKKSLQAADQHSAAQCARILELLTTSYNNLPMPGGQTMFWRLLCMHVMHA